MAKVVGIKFRGVGKSYYFDPMEESYAKGEQVIVELPADPRALMLLDDGQFDNSECVPEGQEVVSEFRRNEVVPGDAGARPRAIANTGRLIADKGDEAVKVWIAGVAREPFTRYVRITLRPDPPVDAERLVEER